MQDNKASMTAMRVATQRAAHQILDEPVVFQDALAMRIIGSQAAQALMNDPARYQTSAAREVRAAVIARSRVAEDELLAAVARGISQVVILGAGLDTFAYRHALPPRSCVYEIDHPATQEWKRQQLHRAGIEIPDTVTFLPVDFDTTSLAQALASAGHDPARPTIFSWLGVVFYLPEDAVRQTLYDIGGCPSGSAVIFDYFEPADNYRADELPGFTAFGADAAGYGEPWQSFFKPDVMEEMLRQAGFDEFEDQSSSTMAARYFGGNATSLRPDGPGRVVRAWRGAKTAADVPAPSDRSVAH